MIDIDPGDFGAESLAGIAPKCSDCLDGGEVGIAAVEVIYPHRPDLWLREDGSRPWYWRCARCGAYVGTHRATLKPLGSPAGPETRAARSRAHAAFDPLWRKRAKLSGIKMNHARAKGYRWLAEQLGIDPKECHIGHMTVAMADRVVDICRKSRGA